MTSDYELLRKKNLEDNKRILAELGLLNPFKPLPRVIKKAVPKFKRKTDDDYVPDEEEGEENECQKPAKKRAKYVLAEDLEKYGSTTSGNKRRSSRLQGKDAPEAADIEEELEKASREVEGEECVKKPPKNRPMVYGAIPGIEIGQCWETRMQCNYDGVHRPTVAGIHPGPEGAYSIALSGGYDDNIDLGECFTYTGEGGRDLKGTASKPKNLRTAPQSKDQRASRGNEALVKSVDTGFPVRVIRGYKLAPFSPYAPEEGYRYDGLYKVEKWWYTTGCAGFGVYKFALKRLPDQPPPPWAYSEDGDLPSDTSAEQNGSQDRGSGVSSTSCAEGVATDAKTGDSLDSNQEPDKPIGSQENGVTVPDTGDCTPAKDTSEEDDQIKSPQVAATGGDKENSTRGKKGTKRKRRDGGNSEAHGVNGNDCKSPTDVNQPSILKFFSPSNKQKA